ncbi:MAG: hypothetical protein H8D22_05530 [Candidatus Cloacimonetes bacterium]|nr:hypothetical protein [Candidatus Cloacimonadota bacterium]
MQTKRKLAAIMFTDIVGFFAMMGRMEENTMTESIYYKLTAKGKTFIKKIVLMK